MSNDSPKKPYDRSDYVSEAIEFFPDGSGRIIHEKFFQSEKVQDTMKAVEDLMEGVIPQRQHGNNGKG